MALAEIREASVANSVSQETHAALTVFYEVQIGSSPRPTAQEELQLYEKIQMSPASKRLLIVVGHGSYGIQKTSR